LLERNTERPQHQVASFGLDPRINCTTASRSRCSQHLGKEDQRGASPPSRSIFEEYAALFAEQQADHDADPRAIRILLFSPAGDQAEPQPVSRIVVLDARMGRKRSPSTDRFEAIVPSRLP